MIIIQIKIQECEYHGIHSEISACGGTKFERELEKELVKLIFPILEKYSKVEKVVAE